MAACHDSDPKSCLAKHGWVWLACSYLTIATIILLGEIIRVDQNYTIVYKIGRLPELQFFAKIEVKIKSRTVKFIVSSDDIPWRKKLEIQLKLDEEAFKARKLRVTESLGGYYYIFFVCSDVEKNQASIYKKSFTLYLACCSAQRFRLCETLGLANNL